MKPLAASMAEIVSRHSASSSTTRIVRFHATGSRREFALASRLQHRVDIDIGASSAARGNSTLTVVPLPIALSIRTPPPDWLASP